MEEKKQVEKNTNDIIDLKIKVAVHETDIAAVKDDIADIKGSMKSNTALTITTLLGVVGTVILLLWSTIQK